MGKEQSNPNGNPKDVNSIIFPDIPEVRNDIARKYSNIEAMDEKVGEIISQLEEDGLLKKTIIMFWSDPEEIS